MIDFNKLLDDDKAAIIKPRDIFMTLKRDERFSFPRDIQTEVMNAWFAVRDQRDTVIKLNVGSGKTVVGLLLLQSSLNEQKGPALYVCPDKQLTAQVMKEAESLGIKVTDDPDCITYNSGQEICVTNIYKLFNGKSVFGVGHIRRAIGTVVVDDAHACIETISAQFRITLPNTHDAYKKIIAVVSSDLEEQNPSRYRDLQNGDPRAVMEVPFWAWKNHQKEILDALYQTKGSDELKFAYPLLCGVLPYCRCIISGQFLEIEPICPPTDLLHSFSKAKRRIYMTATLADDSVLVTHFGAAADKLRDPIVPASSQSMGERMILMPQELNPSIEVSEIRELLMKLAKTVNVVVIVPSKQASEIWKGDTDHILIGDDVAPGIEKLRAGHVGLTVLVNRYDGIDLPGDACRVLAIFDLPEVSSLREATDMGVLAESTTGLRRQMQRVEQGMGRGVRSNDDYCVVLLCGAKLISRIRSPDGQKMFTGATQAQLELSTKIATQLHGTNIDGIDNVIANCLSRVDAWVDVSKKALLRTQLTKGLLLDPVAVALRAAFDLARINDHLGALKVLRAVVPEINDKDVRALLLARQAEIAHHIDPADAQKILLTAQKLNHGVLKPIKGIAYQKLSPTMNLQAAAVQALHERRFQEAAYRVLHVKALTEELVFKPNTASQFEHAINELASLIGLDTQRPEKDFSCGPDNLWAFKNGHYLVIECKNGATSDQGISKRDLGQLGQAISWFEEKYTKSAAKTPLIIHPLNKLGPGAARVEGAKVMTERQLKKLREAITKFAIALGNPDVLNDTHRIANLLSEHKFTFKAFIDTYTVDLGRNIYPASA